jgi:hypothetical protein
MQFHINYFAVIVAAIIQFALGGLWYSPVMFAKKWIALCGLDPATTPKGNMPLQFGSAFIASLISSHALACIISLSATSSIVIGALIGFLCWLGFAGVTSYSTSLFSRKPLQLWMIDSGYNLVSFVIAGGIIAIWQ